ncbi:MULTISPECIES: DEAD/DEAH box helicase [unclassified Dehalobacter]|uniref:DEAD/DEAH box helicase n=1 Tax=unclassified Dehalobacter TaxID=2635733 RepID=UPI000E6CFDD9|nr:MULTISPECIES: DEAD/DEAH box helicase [unclassified Dehalobacter]RJE47986.1 RNA helicase [Dehalobacter sp. MCB1]TCX50606.1 RNA helicase [Dehalobacter sp. 14DCB1]TCX52150.1 RNA helicase [Dehalobacter sp. 12DCB1]
MHQVSFDHYPLSPEILKALQLLNYDKPTNVQKQVIPLFLAQKDVIVKSQTGSGKTAAFAIPLCQLVDWEENKPQALIITPTRELAIQVKEDMFHIGRFKRLKIAAVYGKSPFYYQEKELKQKTHIVVGTPGRLIDHLQKGTLDTSCIKYLVIDEADELMNMGFLEQTETILRSLPANRVTALLSATMPLDVRTLCIHYLHDPDYVETQEETSAVERISQERYLIARQDKIKLLKDLSVTENPDSCLIFCNTKYQVDEVYAELKLLDYPCAKIHGGMEQGHRLSVMDDFKQGYFRYLIATDVAARGIDIEDISLVINFDLPQEKESYVHRIGRTGRLNKNGKAISFITEDDDKYLQDIQKYIGREIPLKQRPSQDTVRNAEAAFHKKITVVPDNKAMKGTRINLEIMKLQINAGKKSKMRPADIVGTLTNIPGMTAADIGIINIQDELSYVEILNLKGTLVLEALQTTPLKGKLRKVRKVNH